MKKKIYIFITAAVLITVSTGSIFASGVDGSITAEDVAIVYPEKYSSEEEYEQNHIHSLNATASQNWEFEYQDMETDWTGWPNRKKDEYNITPDGAHGLIETPAVDGWTNVTLVYDPDFIDFYNVYEETVKDDAIGYKLSNVCEPETEHDWKDDNNNGIDDRYEDCWIDDNNNGIDDRLETQDKEETATVPQQNSPAVTDYHNSGTVKTETTASVSAGKVSIKKIDNKKIKIVVKGAKAGNGIKKVKVKVWTKKKSKTYTAKKQKDGTYAVTVKVSSFKNFYGTYKAQATVTDKKGNCSNSKTVSKKIKKR